MALRPDELPRWADILTNNGPASEPNVSEPDALKKDRGWDFDERPPREWMNWLHLKTYEWLDYHREILDTSANAVVPLSQDEDTTTGLTFGFNGGPVFSGGQLNTIADGTVLLLDNQVNNIYFNHSTLSVEVGALPTYNAEQLFSVTTLAGVITNVVDSRTWAKNTSELAQNADTVAKIDNDDFSVTLNSTLSSRLSSTFARFKSEIGFLDEPGVNVSRPSAATLRGNQGTNFWELNANGLGVNTSPSEAFQVLEGVSLLEFYEDTGTPVVAVAVQNAITGGSLAGSVLFSSEDATNTEFVGASVDYFVEDNTAGSEDTSLSFSTVVGGSEVEQLRLGLSTGNELISKINIHEPTVASSVLKLTNSTSGKADSSGLELTADFGSNISSLKSFQADTLVLGTNSTDVVRILPGFQTTINTPSVGSAPGSVVATALGTSTEALSLLGRASDSTVSLGFWDNTASTKSLEMEVTAGKVLRISDDTTNKLVADFNTAARPYLSLGSNSKIQDLTITNPVSAGIALECTAATTGETWQMISQTNGSYTLRDGSGNDYLSCIGDTTNLLRDRIKLSVTGATTSLVMEDDQVSPVVQLSLTAGTSITLSAPDNKNIELSPNGTAALRARTDGDISALIGRYKVDSDTTTPTSGEAFFYKNAGAAAVSGFQSIIETGSAGARATRITVDNVGNTGFGIGTPANQVHLHTTSTSNVFQMTNSATGTAAGDGMQILTSSLDMLIRNREAGELSFWTSNTKRGYFESTGGLTLDVPLTVNSNILMSNSLPILTIRDSDSSGTAQTGYLSFQDNGSTETSWIGLGSASNTDFTVANDNDVVFRPQGSELVRMSTTFMQISSTAPALRLKDTAAGTRFSQIESDSTVGSMSFVAGAGGSGGGPLFSWICDGTAIARSRAVAGEGQWGFNTTSLVAAVNVGGNVLAEDDDGTTVAVTSTGADSSSGFTVVNDARQFSMRINGGSSDAFEIVDDTSSTVRLSIDNDNTDIVANTDRLSVVAQNGTGAIIEANSDGVQEAQLRAVTTTSNFYMFNNATEYGLFDTSAAAQLLSKNRSTGAINLTTPSLTVNNVRRGDCAVKNISVSAGLSTGVNTVINFDATLYDDDDTNSMTSAANVLTVPTGVTKVRITCGFGITSSTNPSDVRVRIVKNGTALTGLADVLYSNASPGSGPRGEISSHPLVVTAGDTFQIDALQNGGSGVSMSTASISMEIIR